MSNFAAIQELQVQIDLLCDQLDRDSSRFVRNPRRRAEIRADALQLILRRDALRPRRR